MTGQILFRVKNILRSSERGQAMIETALSSMFLMLLLLGAMEMGTMTYAAIEVANSAKAAAQYAAMNGGAWTRNGLDTVGMLAAAQADAGNLVSNISFTTAPTYACVCTGTGFANCSTAPPTGCTSSHLLVTITVKTQANYTPPVRIPGLTSAHIMLKGSAQEAVLQ
jgi:Flp pilus assembly protein TadG